MEFLDQDIYKDKYGIYGIKNKINEKVYVGQTSERFLRRFWHHQWKLKNNSHDNIHLQSAWNKYGEENFEYFVIEIVDDPNLLDELEMKYIAFYKNIDKSYNILSGGGGRRGVPMSDNAKKLIGKKNRDHMLGKKHSDLTKQKMSMSRTGQHVDRKTDILNNELVIKIKKLLISGVTASEIAKTLNIDYKLINNLIANNTWRTVIVDGWDEYRKNRKTYTRLSKKDHQEIYRLHIEDGYNKYQLAEMYNRTVTMIEKILKNNSNKLYDNPVPSSK